MREGGCEVVSLNVNTYSELFNVRNYNLKSKESYLCRGLHLLLNTYIP